MPSKIISITSIPPRFKHLHQTLTSLVNQKDIDEVRLYIPRKYKRFPEWDGSIPITPTGINIIRCEEDLGPATKILPCTIDLRGSDTQILFCDDDGIHHRNWAKKLFDVQSKRPEEAVATWARCIDELDSIPEPNEPVAIQQRIDKDYRYRFERLLQKMTGYKPQWRPIKSAGYAHLLFGVGGVVVRPEFFGDSAFNIPEEAFLVDDIWLSAQLALNGIKLYAPKGFAMPYESENSDIHSLLNLNISKRRRELNIQAMRWCQDNLGVWTIDRSRSKNAG